MSSDEVASRFPRLFQEVTWKWGPARVRFELLEKPPPEHLIANVNLVPHVGGEWIVLRLQDGSWEIPGGTLEPGETYLDAMRRELMEEAGARLLSFQLIGAWRCTSLADKPFRPHLPYPDDYRLCGVGEISFVGRPVNPPGGEKVIEVARVDLATAVARFRSMGRDDLAELYQLAADSFSG